MTQLGLRKKKNVSVHILSFVKVCHKLSFDYCIQLQKQWNLLWCFSSQRPVSIVTYEGFKCNFIYFKIIEVSLNVCVCISQKNEWFPLFRLKTKSEVQNIYIVGIKYYLKTKVSLCFKLYSFDSCCINKILLFCFPSNLSLRFPFHFPFHSIFRFAF